ncbi:hypothetical protein EMIT0P44_230021 [Pseudomonas sp. IT-P44]
MPDTSSARFWPNFACREGRQPTHSSPSRRAANGQKRTLDITSQTKGYVPFSVGSSSRYIHEAMRL